MADGKPRFYTLRKHRKKSVFFAAVGVWLLKYGVDRFREYLTRRQFCQEAKAYSEVTVPALQKPRRLMVFFNATAGKGEADKLFQRNAEPLFHLAALDVTIVKTDYEGQIKTLMQYIDPSIDGIIVAGGDGTLLEAVTGLLRRADQEEVSKIPVGVIPVGTKNSFYNRVFGCSKLTQSRKIGNAAMAIVRGETTAVDIMEIKGEGGRPTFALSGIHWGAFRDAAESYDKYWWTGLFRRKMAYIMKTIQGWPPVHHVALSHPMLDPAERPAISISTADNPGGSSSWRVTSQAMTTASDNHTSDTDVHNRCCHDIPGERHTSDGWVTTSVQTLGLSIEPVIKQVKSDSLMKVKVWPSNLKKTDFIQIGWKMDKQVLTPHDESDASCIMVKELKLQPTDHSVSWFSIDGEPFDARPIHVTLHPAKLYFFSLKQK